ncbi:GNAT family N-acetyltransferase [Kineosporiaceae bacterium SCSIO 59966]|nr:GNAT family N-acetyltransferase [Kineosporiaceae bacterium SCSIO 59966]
MPVTTGWPVTLTDSDVVLRPLTRRDGRAWRRLRADNAAWLDPWEATSPLAGTVQPTFAQLRRELARQGRSGQSIPLAIEYRGRLAGQVTVGGILWGSLRSGHVGYWVDRAVAGLGIAPLAVAMVADHCFGTVGLHRLEVNIRPENAASLRVVAKLGLREEGLRRRYLHIDGAWRDHRSFAVTAEEVPNGLRARLRLPPT